MFRMKLTGGKRISKHISVMKPLEIGTIIESSVKDYIGRVVMRTASTEKAEVLDLTNPGPDNCWTNLNMVSIRVAPLPPETEITLTITKEPSE